MSTVLYLANQQIQVVTGSVSSKKIMVQRAYTADVPEGSIINGIVMDAEALTAFLTRFWQTNKLPDKEVTLVINSSKFVGKMIELPKLSTSKTLEFIDREFTDIRKEQDEIYGYIPLENLEGNARRLYAESISMEFIQEYMDIFKEAGIGVKAIYSGESCLINLTGMTVATRYRTFAMLIADNINLTTLLWVNGSFYHFNSIRCVHEQGTEEYAMDIARSVSQLTQFMKAHQIEYPLETICLAGIEAGGTELYGSALREMGIEVPVVWLDSTMLSANKSDIQSYLHAVSGLVSNGTWQNFLKQYSRQRRKKSEKDDMGKGILIVGAVFAVMLFATLVCLVAKTVKQNSYYRLVEENNSPEVVEQITEYDELLERNAFLARQYSGITDMDENLASYPICDSDVLQVFASCAVGYADVQFESFDAEEGIAVVAARAENVDDINKFIKELNKQTIFNRVDYTGYSFDENTNLWDIYVTCILTEAAGR
jgi:hypothetical protein